MLSRTIIALATLCSLSCAYAAEPASLLSNSDFETAAGDKPADWPTPAGTSWENENGNHFLRLKAAAPGTSITVYRQLEVKGNSELTLTGKFRWTDVVRGKDNWHDGRLLIEFKNAEGTKVGMAPSPLIFVGSSSGWEAKQVAIAVPSDAVLLAVMVAFFQVDGGTLDIDDLHLAAH